MNVLNTCLFRLTAVWQKNGPRPGKPLRRTIVRDFPDAAGAESFLKENNPAGNWPYLFCYQLEMMSECLDGSGSPVMIFERNGNKYGVCDNYKSNCFPGRLEADFKRGVTSSSSVTFITNLIWGLCDLCRLPLTLSNKRGMKWRWSSETV